MRSSTFLGFALIGLTACNTQRNILNENCKTMTRYLNNMKTKSHIRLLQETRAEPDLKNCVPTVRLDKKDKTKDVEIDRRGTFSCEGDARLLYDLNNGWIFQFYTNSVQVDKKKYGFKRTVPILFLGQIDDEEPKNVFGKRYDQVSNNVGFDSDEAGDRMRRKTDFTINADETVTEHRTLSSDANIHYDVIYDFKKQMVFGCCPGSEYIQPICHLKDANPQTKNIYKYAEMLSHAQKTAAVKL